MTTGPWGNPPALHFSQVASSDPRTTVIEDEIPVPSLEPLPLASTLRLYDAHGLIYPHKFKDQCIQCPIWHRQRNPSLLLYYQSLYSDADLEPSPFIPPLPLPLSSGPILVELSASDSSSNALTTRSLRVLLLPLASRVHRDWHVQ